MMVRSTPRRLGCSRIGALWRRSVVCVGSREEVMEASREVPLEAAQGSLLGLAFGSCAFQERPGLGVDAGAGDRDDVQRPVELAVASTV